jgi:tRNA pseudouridine55 synthase
MFGFYNIRKPPGPTSHDIVAAVRRKLPRKTKVGHSGTLDPFASGVLVLCVGSATRLANYVQGQVKQYLAEITLGAMSSTDDCQGAIEPTHDASAIEPQRVAAVITEFLGRVRQVPPAHSAVHVKGERAYNLARAGREFELTAREVQIDRLELIRYNYPTLVVDVECHSGTYIRSLARDIGMRLGVGGYCSALERTAVGNFTVADAVGPHELDIREHLISPLAGLGEMHRVIVSPGDLPALGHGNRIDLEHERPPGEVAIVDDAGRLLAIGEIDTDGRSLHPRKVFPF